LTTYLLDNSVLQRVARAPAVRSRLDDVNDTVRHVLAVATPSVDEACYSATSVEDLHRISRRLRSSFRLLSLNTAVDARVPEIRAALFGAGTGRAAGVVDVLIAAIAVHHGAVVLHYDRDFQHIHDAYPSLRHEWVVPAGSVA
jgi:predicted nucleic acid-binding protein